MNSQNRLLMRMTADPSSAAKACVRCIMNRAADPLISFDAHGLCNHCQRYDRLVDVRTFRGEQARRELTALVEKIRGAGAGREYDCIVGVSGGVDSTYTAYRVKQLGLRALAVHLDNGWDSELAVKNIERVLKRLDIDLYTYVIDWNEFRDLQLAFLRASTPDGEIPTDHAINALLWHQAARRGIRYIISGMNFATESVSVPHWSYGHSDWRYIKDVHRRFGHLPLKTFPRFSLLELAWINVVRRVRIVSLLNYVEYNKADAIATLKEQLGWVEYGGKHHESLYTRFYQAWVLPRKFGIDKRWAHLSDLINSGQMTREAGLREIAQPAAPADILDQDREYAVKKLGLSDDEFEEIMQLPVRSFRDFRNSFAFVERLKWLVDWMRERGWYAR